MAQTQEVNETNEAIEALDRAIQSKEIELNQMRKSREMLIGASGTYVGTPKSNEWEGKGLVWAMEQYLKELGKPATTRDIADAIRDRGVRSSSRHYISTIYASLANSKKFVRNQVGGTWSLAGAKSPKRR